MIDIIKLSQQLIAAKLSGDVEVVTAPSTTDAGPTTYHTRSSDGAIVRVCWSAPPTAQQTSQADAIVQAYDPRPRKPRTMYAIASDIFALSGSLPTPAAGTQKAHVIADLFTGSLAAGAQKWQQDPGPNAAAMSAVYAAITASNGLATFNAAQQLIMAAMYVQDNPTYLVNPAFDATINVPGDQLA